MSGLRPDWRLGRRLSWKGVDGILVKHGHKLTLSLTPAGYGGQRFTPRLVWTRAIQNVTMENECVRK